MTELPSNAAPEGGEEEKAEDGGDEAAEGDGGDAPDAANDSTEGGDAPAGNGT